MLTLSEINIYLIKSLGRISLQSSFVEERGLKYDKRRVLVDESFGPAAAIHSQLKDGHEVYHYTLTKGGATKLKFKLGLSVEEMGEVRYKEMLTVEKALGLTEMKVDDFPDSGLSEMDPRLIEDAVRNEIERIKPNIIVSYPVRGISGFHDHLVMHAVIKRVFLEMKEEGADYLKRLAFITLPDEGGETFINGKTILKRSDPDTIDCIMPLNDDDIRAMKQALACYATYKETIEKSRVIESIGDKLHFEFFREKFDLPAKTFT